MKKQILLTILFSFFLTGIMAQNITKGVTLSVKIKGISGNKGKMMVALYNTKESFLKEPFKASIGNISDQESSVKFKNVPPGIYAISCYYDQNLNQQLDVSGMGIPKEQTGASNNAKGFFGPPKFDDASFEVKEKDQLLIIDL